MNESRVARLVSGKDLLEQFNAADGRMEVEEDGQWEGHPLDDDPWHEAVECCLHNVGSHLAKQIKGNIKIPYWCPKCLH